MYGELDSITARDIIESLASSGQPPRYGVGHFSVGLKPILETLNIEYLSDYIKEGGATFKLLIATYGGGKTHFFLTLRDHAWHQNYAAALVTLDTSSTVFYKLESVYKAIAQHVTRPLDIQELRAGEELGLAALIQSYHAMRMDQLMANDMDYHEAHATVIEQISGLRTDSISFSNAIKSAVNSISDPDRFNKIMQWLLGEMNPDSELKKIGITEKIDQRNAFKMIRSLVKTCSFMGYSGLVIMFDEAERTASLSSRNKTNLLGNLRHVIDACAQTSLSHVMIFYAVPDTNFLDAGSGAYEALNQRVESVFKVNTPRGVQIILDELTDLDEDEFLSELGQKLLRVYRTAYPGALSDEQAEWHIEESAKAAIDERYGDVGFKRAFVKKLMQAFDEARHWG
jgi:hypothetical protein